MIPAAKPIIGAEERAEVDRVLASGAMAQGPEVAAFETHSIRSRKIAMEVNSLAAAGS